ncbi:Ger(x)C family spore germination C-terminal domain-containing protein [Priestia flexa]|uniref:Ger(x)C family spore germination C-terminal domain-containing protein n=1 Tax=Priestia flexa TaxID=86664 RepID=UPI0021751506|nr:Ger(x)C family spore germination C-terminal domain-containing protein [Priestia flexa]
MHFDVYVKTSGRLSEDWDATDQKLSPSFINHIEKNVEKIIQSDTNKILNKLQSDYEADAPEFREYVRINHPAFWKKHRKEWDTIFSNSTIDYHVDVTIEDFGAKTDSG